MLIVVLPLWQVKYCYNLYMLTLPTNRRRSLMLFFVLCVSMLIGVYLLFVILSPTLRSSMVQPKNNATTQQLDSTANAPKQARLYIPKIDVNVPFAANEAALYKGAWWRKPANGNPADGGNFVLAAHRFVMSFTPGETVKRSPFYAIDKLQKNDAIYVDYKGKRYGYMVTKKMRVQPNAVYIEQRTEQPQLTLYSCTLAGQNDGREVIVALPAS